jgi:hypothetical protein
MEENRIPKRVLCINLETRPRNRWQDEVREDGRVVGGEEWQEKVYDREEWKKLLKVVRNCCILYMPMEYNRICEIQVTFTLQTRSPHLAYLLAQCLARDILLHAEGRT